MDAEDLSFNVNPDLVHICVDEKNLQEVSSKVNEYGYVDCQVTTYCSFIPGGEVYSISGNNIFDRDSNGCDSNDLFYKDIVKISIFDLSK